MAGKVKNLPLVHDIMAQRSNILAQAGINLTITINNLALGDKIPNANN